MVVIGGVTAALVGAFKDWWYAPATGWLAAALSYDILVWSGIFRLDAAETRQHIQDEDDGRKGIEALILVANLTSLGGVVLMISQADQQARIGAGALALGCTCASWLLVHTAFALHYAKVYYSEPVGGINFNQDEDPDYLDFAYTAFSIGMTYVVSDTAITSRSIRRVALVHSLVSFIFGLFILTTSINVALGIAS